MSKTKTSCHPFPPHTTGINQLSHNLTTLNNSYMPHHPTHTPLSLLSHENSYYYKFIVIFPSLLANVITNLLSFSPYLQQPSNHYHKPTNPSFTSPSHVFLPISSRNLKSQPSITPKSKSNLPKNLTEITPRNQPKPTPK